MNSKGDITIMKKSYNQVMVIAGIPVVPGSLPAVSVLVELNNFLQARTIFYQL